MKKISDVTKQTTANIVNAFWKCYEKTSFDDITVKSITFTAGYNRSTFYEYFDNISNLLDYAETDLLMHLKNIIDDTISEGASESCLENALKRCFDEYGNELRILLTPFRDLHFFEKFRDILKPLALVSIGKKSSNSDIELLCELVITDITSTIIYICHHAETSQEHAIQKLHTYIRNGAPGILSNKI